MVPSKMTPEQAFALYDKCESVTFEELLEVGVWRGGEIMTGHPMDGILTAVSWYGKKFEPDKGVHPLLYTGVTGKVYSGNFSKLPLNVFLSWPRWLVKFGFFFVAPLIRTKKASTQIWNVEYRGKITAAMVWDTVPIVEIFTRIDNNTLLGVTVIKGLPASMGYFFTLSKPQ